MVVKNAKFHETDRDLFYENEIKTVTVDGHTGQENDLIVNRTELERRVNATLNWLFNYFAEIQFAHGIENAEFNAEYYNKPEKKAVMPADKFVAAKFANMSELLWAKLDYVYNAIAKDDWFDEFENSRVLDGTSFDSWMCIMQLIIRAFVASDKAEGDKSISFDIWW
ncbi:hypothetical protein [Weissella cibaria]|uniref:hypothetical protein n=1 Tax=Weissella cibaria TaxID=137591 RepID=UPI00106ED827|nr:hypothetical protein [Weissella cibaria]